MTIIYTMTAETKASLTAALAAHGTDRLALAGLGRVRLDDDTLATGGIMAAWPADADGMYRVALTETAGLIAWRSFILGELDAGRGLRAEHLAGYREALGVAMQPAYDYVCAAAKGHPVRPCVDAEHTAWSESTGWVAGSGNAPDPSRKWGRSVWRGRAHAHEALAAAGIALPGRNVWRPVATCLFSQPKSARPEPTLTPEDDDALAELIA